MGCTAEAIVAELGLQMSDLFFKPSPPVQRSNGLTVATLAKAKHLDPSLLKEYGLLDGTDCVIIRYKLQDGRPAPKNRVRTDVKARAGSKWSARKGVIVPYGLWRLPDYRQAGHTTLLLVEGESCS